MPDTASSPWLKLAYGATIFLSAFLLFQVQPIIGKIILPWYGGSASVWTTCLLFFQFLLLLGYLYSHGLATRLAPRTQAWVHLTLLAAALALLPIAPDASWKPAGEVPPSIHILMVLAISVGLPYFVLATTGPLVQVWFARERPGAVPYRLFALSNLGSMAGLLTYPAAIEPLLSVRVQSWTWAWAFACFAGLSGLLALRSRAPARGLTAGIEQPELYDRPGRATPTLWLLLALCPSLLLVSLTSRLTREVAPIPMLWIAPLAIYLLTFILCFDHSRWYRRRVFLPLFLAALGALGYLTVADADDISVGILLATHLACLFVLCMVCHGEIYRLRPPVGRLTAFYLVIAAGGALGGLFAALFAPYAFNADYEFPIGVVLTAAVAALVWTLDETLSPSPALRTLVAVAGLNLVLGLGYLFARQEIDSMETALLAVRNFYGSLRVDEEDFGDDAKRQLLHGKIIHGEQFLERARSRWPRTYYSEDSGIGRALRSLELSTPALRVGIIGLGAGTLAAYGRPGDRYTFYEINPAVLDVARTEFSYLRDTPARTEVVLGDARRSLEQEPPRGFDLLVVDAFSGDAIPVHLLTREAFAQYFRHLGPDGILAIHVSNRYLDLAPVVRLGVEGFGRKARVVETEEDEDAGLYAATWILVAQDSRFRQWPFLDGQASEIPFSAGIKLWTDDYSSVLPILK